MKKVLMMVSLLALVAVPSGIQSVVAVPALQPELNVGGFLIGPQAYSFNRFSFFEAVDKAKEAGANVIEMYPGQKLSPEDSRPISHTAEPEVWAKALLKLEKAGVRVVNYGVVAAGDEKGIQQIFDFAKIMGIPCVTTEPTEGKEVEMLDIYEKFAKLYDIKVAIHNHPKRDDHAGYKIWDPQFVLDLVKDRDSRVGAGCDTGHWVRSGVKPLEAIQLLKGRVISLHLKDLNEFSPSGHDVPFGQGIGDVEKILDELRAQGFDGNISIEYEHNWDNNVGDIAQCIDFVREYGKKN